MNFDFKDNLIFDSHAHYDDRRFDEDRAKIIEALPSKNVCGIINAASDLNSAKKSLALAKKYPFMWASVGVHPHEAKKTVSSGDWESALRGLLSENKVVAIGEIGLDYYYDNSPRDIQKEVFEKQIRLALEYDLPVIVHDRDAHQDVWELLRKHKPKGVVHAFSGSVEMAREITRLGMYIGLGGVVTFKNAVRAVEVAKDIDESRLLLETDAPYMTPEPFRGKRNDSSKISYVAEKIAEIRNVSNEHILKVTKKNACDLFNIKL